MSEGVKECLQEASSDNTDVLSGDFIIEEVKQKIISGIEDIKTSVPGRYTFIINCHQNYMLEEILLLHILLVFKRFLMCRWIVEIRTLFCRPIDFIQINNWFSDLFDAPFGDKHRETFLKLVWYYTFGFIVLVLLTKIVTYVYIFVYSYRNNVFQCKYKTRSYSLTSSCSGSDPLQTLSCLCFCIELQHENVPEWSCICVNSENHWWCFKSQSVPYYLCRMILDLFYFF